MKSIINLVTLLLILLTTFNSSGCKKKTQPDCGCDAPTRTTIEESSNLIGMISFNRDPIQGFNSYKNTFGIVYVEQNCVNCVHYMVICNEFILPQQILDLKNTNQSLQVKFAGYLKPVCDKIIAPGDYTYENIYLTKIEIQ